MKIYTKKGDLGETDLIGKRTLKSDLLIDLVGEIDEANVRIALAKKVITDLKISNELHLINRHLFTISSDLVDVNQILDLHINVSSITHLETQIDEMESVLPKVTHFITYDGTEAAIRISSLRSQVRLIERLLVSIHAKKEIIMYINRLSDYLFVLMRYINHQSGHLEIKLDTI